MKNILVLRSSINAANSISNQMADAFVDKIRRQFPSIVVVERDLANNPVPALTPETVGAIRAGVSDTAEQQAAANLANTLIDELKNADAVIMGVPRYNFHVPATLKAYFDYIARPRITFAYGANGPEGLLPAIPVYALVASGGIYSNNPNDSLTLWLQQALGFVGLQAHVIHTEGVAMGDEAMQAAFNNSKQQFDQIINRLK